MNNINFELIKKILKTGELKKELAKAEIKNNKVWTNKELERAVKETNCNNITRKDIEIEKALLLNKEYQKLLNDINNLCDNFNNDDKEILLEIVNKKDLLYEKIVNKFN